MEDRRADLKQAERFLRRAKKDLVSAQVLRDNKCYEDACYHSQQCAEKAIKAFLILRGRFALTHAPAPILLEEIEKISGDWKERLLKAQEQAEELEDYWLKPRYPDVEWREYTKAEAKEAVRKAGSILKTLQRFLGKEYGLDIEEKKKGKKAKS